MGKTKTGITPTRAENYAEWYQQVIVAADLAENASVRGCMVIKPWGYAIWERLQGILDQHFKATGHQNAYFPLFIPVRYLQREAEHVEGFAKECAVVTHSRLQLNEEGQLIPASPLEEPLIVRPTSETIIGESFSRWVQSYRDLPLLINQWANVVRWEMRTRLFLRTSEFLWQEGHTAHETAEEATHETKKMLEIYRKVVEEDLAISVVLGEKTASERFPGAVSTYTLEAMMQDKKALQCGTSHFLGQNFSKAMSISFVDESGQKQFAWTTSWGVSTRLMGALIMTHSDDDGLVLPPHLAPIQVVLLPIVHDETQRVAIETYCKTIEQVLLSQDIRVQIDTRDMRGGEKRWQWIKKGVCCLVEIGQKEVEANKVTYAFRDTIQMRESLDKTLFLEQINSFLETFQQRLLQASRSKREAATKVITREKDFYEFFKQEGGFAVGYWSEDPEVEARIKQDLKVTVRCLPLESKQQYGPCLFTNKTNCPLAVFAKAY